MLDRLRKCTSGSLAQVDLSVEHFLEVKEVKIITLISEEV